MTNNTDFMYSGSENLEIMAEAKYYNRYLTTLVDQHLVHSAPVLDFGSGLGTFAKFLRERGRKVICLEPDKHQAEACRNDGFETLAALSTIPPETVDSIYSLNVLEHIADDQACLEELATCLRKGGKLVLYVPAFQILFSSMDRKVGHFRRYRRQPLMGLLQQAGFRICKAKYVDCLGFVAALAFRAIGNSSGNIGATSIKLYDHFVFPVSLAFDTVFHKWFGKNLFIVAEKL